MKKDAKIGLSIILGAVLLSALIIGKALQSRTRGPLDVPDEAGAPASPEGSGEDLALDRGAGRENSEGGSLDRLTGSGDGSREHDYPDGNSTSGSLADAGSPGNGSKGASGSETFGLSGTVPVEGEGRVAPGADGSAGPVAGNSHEDSSGAGSSVAGAGTAEEEGAAPGGAGGGELSVSGGTGAAPGTTAGSAKDGGATGAGESGPGGSGVDAAVASNSGGSVTPPAGSDFPYTVQENDSAWKIAKRFLGSGIHWKKVTAANPDVDFGRLRVGTKLTIPGRIGGSDSRPRPAPEAAPASPATGSGAGARIHRVVSGENLYVIAKKYLGSGMRYKDITRLNPGVDPNRLRIGQKLKIPAR